MVVSIRNVYVNTALAMLENYENFTYDSTAKVYESNGVISYEVEVMSYKARIEAADVVVEITEDSKVGKISCTMKQFLIEENNGESFLCELYTQFTYSEYGTVVLPLA